MSKRALIVGINEYDTVTSLWGCVKDATGMADVLARNDDGSINFDCKLFTSPGPEKITRGALKRYWNELFHEFRGDVLFYFSGHGTSTNVGGYIVTQEGTPEDPGLAMSDLLVLANDSAAKTVLLILDCCFSGSVGNLPGIQNGKQEDRALLREGVTILAASRPGQVSMEVGGHGVFTKLVVGALKGGAADVRGRVSAASIYAYAEAALGPWDQRPQYKSHATQLDPVRTCEPRVSDSLIRELPVFFPTEGYGYQLDQTFEETNSLAKPENVATFKKFKLLQIAGLLKPLNGQDLYWAAESYGSVVLTTLGRLYRQLVIDTRI
jgi:caspase domain-containing protein